MERILTVSLLLLLHIFSGYAVKLLYSNRRAINLLETNPDQRTANGSTSHTVDKILANKLDDAIAVGFHYEEQFLFWTDVSLEKIMRKSLKNEHSPAEVVISTGLVRPEWLAVDWVTNKFYWTDSYSKLIEVANMDGTQRSVLFWSNVDQPRAVVVDPLHGYMFWSDWGEEAKIVRAGMDGSDRKNIITKDIKWPNGLAVDYEEARLYWLDAHNSHSCVASSNLNGTDRRKVVGGSLPHPFAITIFGDHVYWTDWTTKSIHACNKNTGDGKWLVKDNIDSLMDLRSFDQKRQPKSKGVNPCGKQNGGCSDLCLLAPLGGRTCACPTGVALLPDRTTCQNGPQHFILVAKRTELRLLSLDTPDHTAVVLPIHNIKQALVVDFDPVEGFVYWTDQDLHMIKRARLDGTDELIVARAEVKHPEGIAVDFIGRNLYWSDTGTDRIEVCHLNGSSRRVLVSENLDEPRAMAVDPREGYLYWTDWGANPRIERSWLDGTHRQVLVNSSILWPNGLALDYDDRKIYWADAKLNKIEVCNLDGSGRKVLWQSNVDLPHIYGFGLIGKHLYWTDWQRRNLQKVHIDSKSKDILVEHLPDVMGLRVVDINIKYGSNACQQKNGGCSHLCLYTPGGVQCECPMGLELTKNNKTCVVPEAFLLFTRSRSIRRLSIESSNGDKLIPIPGIEDANAVDFHINDSRVFWTDISLNRISRAFLNGSTAEVVVGVDLVYPDGLAVDWVGENIYWTDSYLPRIECARLDGRHRKTLIWNNITEPHSLALDPRNGFMYWSEWSEKVGIYRAQMDGKKRVLLIENHSLMLRPNSLVIDFNENKVYWTEQHLSKILRADLGGGNIEVVLEGGLPHPNCLSQYKDFIYWGDQHDGTISRASKLNGGNRTRIEGHLGLIMDIKVFHDSRQIGWNNCGLNNGGCSHLCLALPDQKYTCACPNHYVLNVTNKSCTAPQLFLLYSSAKEVRRLLLNQDDDLDVILPLNIIHRIKSIEYDLHNDMVYWISEYSGQGSIFRSFVNGSSYELIVGNGKQLLRSPFDLALDPYGRKLYWTDELEKNIKVTCLKTLLTGVIIDDGKSVPRAITIDPKRGFVYWTNFTKTTVTIEKARMSGAREPKGALMKMNIDTMEPGKLTADPNGEFLYFVEVRKKKIVKLSLKDLTYSDLLVQHLLEPKSLSVNNDFLYCLDKESGKLKILNKHTGHQEGLLVGGGIKEGTDVLVIDKTNYDIHHPCHGDNGNCSNLCTVIEDKATCSCPKHLILGKDQKTCGPPPTCDGFQFACKTGTCIHLVWKCDGDVECDDGSDEENCSRKCRPDQFTCDNKQCVKKGAKCDGISYCSDGSDLKECKKCKDDQFRCNDDKCIPLGWKCDAVDDCEDKSDEDRVLCANMTEPSSPGRLSGSSAHKEKIVIVCICGVALIVFFFVIYFIIRAKRKPNNVLYTTSYLGQNTPLSNISSFYDGHGSQGMADVAKSDERSLSITTNPTESGEEYYNREDLTGRSRSTVQPSYIHSLENPPPSPATLRSNFTSVSDKYCAGSPTPSTCRLHRQPYRQTMPSYYATPVSTDMESSVSKYVAMRSKPLSSAYSSVSCSDCESAEYDIDAPPPPPPTICTNYYSDMLPLSDNEDLPPSPSSENCFIIEPDPPPPSPVTDSPSVA